jgi:hypothetical protein
VVRGVKIGARHVSVPSGAASADHGGRDASAVLQLCGALAVTLLQASRHAARAA